MTMYEASEKRYESMIYNRCGGSGLKLPMISLGMWHNFGSHANYESIKEMCFTAFDHGITHFDLANNYGPVAGAAEENIGKIINNEMKNYRDELVISTKAGYDMWQGPYGNGGSKKHLTASLDQSLKRLKLDYVDIYYHHRPDPDTCLEETILALDEIVKSGKALYIGISNYTKTQTEVAAKLFRELKTPFIVNQSRYSLFDRRIEQDGLKQYAADNGLGIIAFCPLAQGLLTNKYLYGIPDDSRIAVDGRFLSQSDITDHKRSILMELNEVAKMRGQSLAQMALSWILRDNQITSVLIGASRASQIEENIKIVSHTEFDVSELSRIEEICSRL